MRLPSLELDGATLEQLAVLTPLELKKIDLSNRLKFFAFILLPSLTCLLCKYTTHVESSTLAWMSVKKIWNIFKEVQVIKLLLFYSDLSPLLNSVKVNLSNSDLIHLDGAPLLEEGSLSWTVPLNKNPVD
jgi:hypothetical protein